MRLRISVVFGGSEGLPLVFVVYEIGLYHVIFYILMLLGFVFCGVVIVIICVGLCFRADGSVGWSCDRVIHVHWGG